MPAEMKRKRAPAAWADGIGAAVQPAKRAVPAPLRRALRRAQRAVSYMPRRLMGTVTHVITDQPAVALTFDDGPDPRSTPWFLEVLEAHGARGTFFLIGQSAERHPGLVQRIVARGHAVGNHSWDHRSFPRLARRERRDQLRAWSRACSAGAVRMFRPPYGDQTLLSRLDPLWLGWQVVTWNIDANDWRGESAEHVAHRVLERLRPGAIVLFHDALFHYEDARFVARDAAAGAVERVLEAAADYRFVTVPELLRLGRPNRELWIQPGDPAYLAALKREEVPPRGREARSGVSP